MQFTTELFIAPQIQEQRILQVHRCIAYGHKWQCQLFTHFQHLPAPSIIIHQYNPIQFNSLSINCIHL